MRPRTFNSCASTTVCGPAVFAGVFRMTSQARGKTFAESSHRMTPIGVRSATVDHHQALASIGARLHRIRPKEEARMATVTVRGVAAGLATHVALGPPPPAAPRTVGGDGGRRGPPPYEPPV